jgi:hypothetical protein
MLARLSLRARAAALFPLAALAVHDGFYRVGGPHAGAGTGHGYLAVVDALAGALGALTVAALVARLLAARRAGAEGEARVSWLGLWAVAAAGLLAIFAGQELLEAAVAGHPVAFLASGGWIAAPLALAAGGLLTLLLRGAGAAAAAVARRTRRPLAPPRGARAARPLAPRTLRPSPAPLALCAAGRAPPSLALWT